MTVPTGTIELKKYSLRQTREGTIIAFVVHPNDAPVWLSSDPIGTVYAAALVRMDEEGGGPSPVARQNTAEPPLDEYGGGTPKRKLTWDELPYRTQSGIRCNDERFTRFLEDEYVVQALATDADRVRYICGVESRSELIKGTPAGDRWHDLDLQFQAWLREEAA